MQGNRVFKKIGQMVLLVFIGSVLGAAARADNELQIWLIRPNVQNVADVQQITVTFNKPMVPLGDFEKLAKDFPIDVSPKVECSWRWLNNTTIACQLNQALPPSHEYKITVPSGIKSLDGSVLKSSKTETFTTLAWSVVHQEIEWKGPDVPTIYVAFNQPMDLGSLQSHSESPCGALQVAKIKDSVARDLGLDPSRTYVYHYERSIGIDKACVLMIKGDARSAIGPVVSQPFSYNFTTYPDFKIASVECHPKITGKAVDGKTIKIDGCNPDFGLWVSFTTPTTGERLAGKIKTEPLFGWSPGGEGSPEYYEQNSGEEFQSIAFRSPMQGASHHTVQFSRLKDRFGRPLVGQDQIHITTSDFSPMLQLPSGYSVLEKFGPHQLGFSGVNAKEVELKYYQSHSLADIKMWGSHDVCPYFDYDTKHRKPFIFEDRMQKTVVRSGAQPNLPFLVPMDLSKIDPDYKYGMFVGRIERAWDIHGAPLQDVCKSFFSVVTDLGLMAKVGFYSSGIWVHSIKSGQPVSGIKVGLYSEKGPIFEGITDSKGFFEGPGAQKWDSERNKYVRWVWGGPPEEGERLYVVAASKDDFSMLPFATGQKGLDYYDFNQFLNPLTQSSNHIIYSITDRPLYMPGQKVNVKVFARHWEPRTYGLQPAKEINIDVRDVLSKSIFTKTVKLSEFGTASFSFDLDPSSPLGSYNIMIGAGDVYLGWAGSFEVQVFTLPVFKVQVEPQKEQFDVGDSANFLTTARYHFGGGVPNTAGAYTANFTPGSWRPKSPKWESFAFDNAIDLNIPGYEKPRAFEVKQIAQGEIKTDNHGDVTSEVLLPPDQLKSYGRLEYGVTFHDDRGKNIAGYSSVEVFYSQFSLGIKTPEWAYQAKEKITPEVVVLDHTEKPIAGVSVELKLVNRTYKTVRRRGEGSYFYYDTTTKDLEVATCSFKSAESPKGCGLKSYAAGDYYIVATAKDPRGRTLQTALQRYVTGKEYIGWFRQNHDRIDVIPEKNSYQVGETAKFIIKHPFQEVDALITIERFGILKQFRKKLTSGSEVITFPIDSHDYAPGFYFAVHLIKGRVSEKIEGGVDLGRPSFKMGLASIRVEDPDTVLKVIAKPDREQYKPGEKVKVSLSVTSPAGNDIAELSVAVVDEKILQLSGGYNERYQLHDKFYNLRGGDVITSQMLSFLVGRRHFGKKGAPAGGDGASGDYKIRKNILPLAYWNPTVKTDKAGKAEVSLSLPDNVTTWRVLVVAADQKHRFGFGSGTFRASKKVMIEQALPSFLTEGDKLNARFTVFNRTGADADITCNIKTTGVEVQGISEKRSKILSEGKSYFDWAIKTPFGKTAAIFKVLASAIGGQDGIQQTIPIYPYASYETFANYGSTIDSKVSESLQIPRGIRPELGGLEVMFSPSLISHLDDSFRYLFSYPYSCWEQTMVRAIALGQYVRLKRYLSIPGLSKDPETWASELLGEMPKFQYDNGAMAYWKPDPRTTDPYLSVFTALGLQWLKTSKVKLPDEARKKLLGYVHRLAQGTEAFPNNYTIKSKATILAMASYVLAQEGENTVALTNKLFQERQNLSLFGKSFLWMAAAKLKETHPLLSTLKNEVYSSADITSGSIQFQEQHDDGFVQILHSTTRTNCSILSAMLLEDPHGPFVEPLVRWIIAGRKSNRWNNTQENLYCQNALVQYASYYEKDTPKYRVSGSAMGKSVKSISFKSFKDAPRSQTLFFTPAVVGKKLSLNLEKKGKGRLYYTARMRIAYKDVRTSPVNSGMQVARSYFVKAPDGSWQPQGSLIKLKRGQLVKVVLKVSIPAVRHQVVLEDRLPACLEPVNTALGGTSKEDASAEANHSSGDYFWNEDDNWYGFYSSGGFYHREMRLHAVQYFADFMSPGEFNLAYVAQAIATGEFNANPAIIEQMYEPEVYGKSTPAQFVITE